MRLRTEKCNLAEPDIITPDDIDTDGHFFNAFDHCETETSANWLVQFAQERGKGWKPFTKKQIEKFYKNGGQNDGFTFNRLTSYYIEDEGNKYYFTTQFVDNCFKSRPATKYN